MNLEPCWNLISRQPIWLNFRALFKIEFFKEVVLIWVTRGHSDTRTRTSHWPTSWGSTCQHLKTSFSRWPSRGTTLHQLETSVAARLGQQQVLEPAIPVYKGIGVKVWKETLGENTENVKELSNWTEILVWLQLTSVVYQQTKLNWKQTVWRQTWEKHRQKTKINLRLSTSKWKSRPAGRGNPFPK